VEFDAIELFTNTTPAMAFGILAYYFNRRDHIDMLRREQTYNQQLAAIIGQQIEQSEARTAAMVRLERRVHDLANAVHRLGTMIDPSWRRVGNEQQGDDR